MRLWNLLWARPTSVIATISLMVVLAFPSLTGRSDWSWTWIGVLFAFIVFHSIVGWVQERSTLNSPWQKS